jgi:hypothetical protein
VTLGVKCQHVNGGTKAKVGKNYKSLTVNKNVDCVA